MWAHYSSDKYTHTYYLAVARTSNYVVLQSDQNVEGFAAEQRDQHISLLFGE